MATGSAETGAVAAAIAGLVGAGGLGGAILNGLFSRRKTAADVTVALNAAVDARIKLLLDADAARLKQMSDAITEQSDRIERQSAKLDMLIQHVAMLEGLLLSAGLAVPPRPLLDTQDAAQA